MGPSPVLQQAPTGPAGPRNPVPHMALGRANHTRGLHLGWGPPPGGPGSVGHPCPQLWPREQFLNHLPKPVPPRSLSCLGQQPDPIVPWPWRPGNSPGTRVFLTLKSSGAARAGGSGGATGGGRMAGGSRGPVRSMWHRSIPTSAWSWASSSVCCWATCEPGGGTGICHHGVYSVPSIPPGWCVERGGVPFLLLQ